MGELIFEADGNPRTRGLQPTMKAGLAFERAFPISPGHGRFGAATLLTAAGEGATPALSIGRCTDTAPDSWGRKIIELLRGTQYH